MVIKRIRAHDECHIFIWLERQSISLINYLIPTIDFGESNAHFMKLFLPFNMHSNWLDDARRHVLNTILNDPIKFRPN